MRERASAATVSRSRSNRGSWQWPLPRDEQQLRGERDKHDRQRPAKKLRVAHEGANSHGRALERIDLLGNALQSGGIACTEVAAARRIGDIGQQCICLLYTSD